MAKTYKLLQLNVLNFLYFDKIIELLIAEDPDIVTFQEVSENNLLRLKNILDFSEANQNFIEKLKQMTKLKYGEFFKGWAIKFENDVISNWGIGIFSKYPLVDYSYYFDKQVHSEYKIFEKTSDPFFMSEDKKIRNIYSMQKPSVFGEALINIDNKFIKIFTGHFAISDLCTETLQRVNQIKEIINFASRQKSYPQILSADFNITEDSASIGILKNDGFECLTTEIINSLDKTIHPIFDPKKAIRGMVVENLKVDHILGKEIEKINSRSIENARVSDHLPIILEFTF